MNPQELINEVNIAESLDEDRLKTIAKDCVDGYHADLKSREHFEKLLETWTKLALQVADKKTYPWPNASNVKYPLLSTAAMQFAARAYPSLVPSNGQVVKAKVIGRDPQGVKTILSEVISRFMSYQVMDEMEEWESEMDKLLIALPIVGTVFKKTYWDRVKQRNVSCVILPKNLVVNYWARSIEDAERISEIIPMSKRKLKEKQLAKVYLDLDLGEPEVSKEISKNVEIHEQTQSDQDETTPYTIIEQHCFIDLDDDGYAEPYIVVFDERSENILRISARFDEEGLQVDEKGNVVKIEPDIYYTKFGFVPNPDGSFYDIGFGRLLGPINESADSLINQLVDAGSLSNLQAGFIGKGLRIKMAETRFTPGEWKSVNATGDDLKKQIFPLPVREPSPVLMQLLQFLIQSGKELASVAEIFVGKMPGQNTPATTTMASIEQGMKVFTAVYKRIFRSLTQEFRLLYKLNRKYLNPQEMVDLLGIQVGPELFQQDPRIVIPAADPAAVSSQEKQQKVQAVGQLLQLGTINPMAFTQMYLEAHEIPSPEKLIMQPQPKADPEAEKMQMEAKIKQEEAAQKIDIEKQKMQIKSAEAAQKIQAEKVMSEMKMQQAARMGHLETVKAMQGHQQTMMQNAQSHQMNMQQKAGQNAAAKKELASKPKPKK